MAITLKAQERSVKGKKVKALRREGLVPAEVYGKGGDNISVQFTEVDLKLAIREAGTTRVISLDVDGKNVDVLLKDVVRSLDRKSITHVDLYSVDKNIPVKTVVPVVATGESPLIARGGIAVTGASNITISALPANIPPQVTVDLSTIVNFSDVINAGDIALDEGVTLESNPSVMIAYISQTRASRAAAAAEKQA